MSLQNCAQSSLHVCQLLYRVALRPMLVAGVFHSSLTVKSPQNSEELRTLLRRCHWDKKVNANDTSFHTQWMKVHPYWIVACWFVASRSREHFASLDFRRIQPASWSALELRHFLVHRQSECNEKASWIDLSSTLKWLGPSVSVCVQPHVFFWHQQDPSPLGIHFAY